MYYFLCLETLFIAEKMFQYFNNSKNVLVAGTSTFWMIFFAVKYIIFDTQWNVQNIKYLNQNFKLKIQWTNLYYTVLI